MIRNISSLEFAREAENRPQGILCAQASGQTIQPNVDVLVNQEGLALRFFVKVQNAERQNVEIQIADIRT
jgi:hypothetical protein